MLKIGMFKQTTPRIGRVSPGRVYQTTLAT